MSDIRRYSEFFSCLHDEIEPVGHLGRGTHYSVFRVPSWRDEVCASIPVARLQDFAIIWDEDHDDRVASVAERIYMEGLLSPVLFIGERKGTLTVVVSERCLRHMGEAQWESYKKGISDICAAVPTDGDIDYWPVEFGSFAEDGQCASSLPDFHSSLVDDSLSKVETYLRNIYGLWSLGLKPYDAPRKVQLLTASVKAALKAKPTPSIFGMKKPEA